MSSPYQKIVVNGRPFSRDYLKEPCQLPKAELFAKIVHDFQPLTVFAKSSMLDA